MFRHIRRNIALYSLIGVVMLITACGSSGGDDGLPAFDTSCLPLSVPGATASLGGYAFDPNGDLLFNTWIQDDIRLLDRETCALSTVATSVSGLTLTGLTSENPIYATSEDGNVYTVDQSSGVSTVLAATGTVPLNVTIAPAGYGAYGGKLIVGGMFGEIIAIDQSQPSPTPSTIATVGGVAADLIFGSDGTLYVADYNGKIVTVAADGTVSDFAVGLLNPDGLAIDNARGLLFVADSGTDTLNQVTIPGRAISDLGSHDFDDGAGSSGIIYDTAGKNIIFSTGESSMTIDYMNASTSPVPVVNNSTDPTGDAECSACYVAYDITDVKTYRTGPVGGTTYDHISVVVTFNQPVSIPASGAGNAPTDLYGYLEIDTDENAATGTSVGYNAYCGATSMGMEYFVDFVNGRTAPGGGYNIIVNSVFTPVGEATPYVSGNTLTLVIPLADLGGDDGSTDIAFLIGDAPGPTDCAPDGGGVLYQTMVPLGSKKVWK